jgi:trigger factor
MPTITHENSDALNAVLTVVLAKDKYMPKVNRKLKEYRQKAEVKGFRSGKVPMGMIKRKVGTSLLVEEVNTIVSEGINEYFKEKNLKVLGQPVAIEDKSLVFNVNKPTDYTFTFELGIAPEFEVKGLSTDILLPFYDIAVDDADVANEIAQVRKKNSGGFEDNVTDIIAEDMLVISLEELDENGALKEGGAVKEETYLTLKDIVNEELKDNLLTATISDTFDVNVFNIEDKEEDFVKKHVLGIEADQVINEMFRLTIKEVKRVKIADLNEDFFNQLFPEQGVKTEEEFTEKVREEITKSYKQSSLGHYTNLAFNYLVENNELELPKDFLRRWLEDSQEDLTNEFFEGEEFQGFLKNLRWSLVREKIAEQFNIEVNYQDVEDMARKEVLGYFNYQIPSHGEMMDNMLEKVLSDKKEVNRRFEVIMDQRVLENAAENMGKEMKPVTKEEFETIIKEYNDAQNPPALEQETAKEEVVVAEEVEVTE